jgi:hypothetical protein
MEAILQAFARMEKREKRREQALEKIGTKSEGGIKEEPPATPEADMQSPGIMTVSDSCLNKFFMPALTRSLVLKEDVVNNLKG